MYSKCIIDIRFSSGLAIHEITECGLRPPPAEVVGIDAIGDAIRLKDH
jgi:hypothetical protein